MPTQLSNKRGKKKLVPLERSDQTLDELSAITPADIEASKAEWDNMTIGALLNSNLVRVEDGTGSVSA